MFSPRKWTWAKVASKWLLFCVGTDMPCYSGLITRSVWTEMAREMVLAGHSGLCSTQISITVPVTVGACFHNFQVLSAQTFAPGKVCIQPFLFVPTSNFRVCNSCAGGCLNILGALCSSQISSNVLATVRACSHVSSAWAFAPGEVSIWPFFHVPTWNFRMVNCKCKRVQ